MDDNEIFEEINRILEEADMDLRINDIEELEEFLEANESEDLDIYEEIRELYDQLIMGVGTW
jgi:hypothetical protein